MKPEDLKEAVRNLAIWQKSGQRAPHKPLLILYALAQLKSGRTRFIPYAEVREKLGFLLKEFGPPRKSYHPEQPFVRLKNDGIWELNTEVQRNQFSNKMLMEGEVAGGFTKDVFLLLTRDQRTLHEVAQNLLDAHFPETFHDDILEAIGLDFEYTKKKKRDASFRERVLKAYEYSCAICGFSGRLSNTLVGLEAAHIMWHHAGGPDSEENGMALCSLHHKLFDRGVYTFTPEGRLVVSEFAHGNEGFKETVLKYHNEPIQKPLHPSYLPNEAYLDWHFKEVFRRPGRYIAM